METNKELNRVVELEKRIEQGRCDPALCSETCSDCPMGLNKKREKRK